MSHAYFKLCKILLPLLVILFWKLVELNKVGQSLNGFLLFLRLNLHFARNFGFLFSSPIKPWTSYHSFSFMPWKLRTSRVRTIVGRKGFPTDLLTQNNMACAGRYHTYSRHYLRSQRLVQRWILHSEYNCPPNGGQLTRLQTSSST